MARGRDVLIVKADRQEPLVIARPSLATEIVKQRDRRMKVNQKPEAEVEVIDLSKHKGELKCLGGSMSDIWNDNLANETIRALCILKIRTPR
jgi:hypothetical protein